VYAAATLSAHTARSIDKRLILRALLEKNEKGKRSFSYRRSVNFSHRHSLVLQATVLAGYAAGYGIAQADHNHKVFLLTTLAFLVAFICFGNQFWRECNSEQICCGYRCEATFIVLKERR